MKIGETYTVRLQDHQEAMRDAMDWFESGEERAVKDVFDTQGKARYATAIAVKVEEEAEFDECGAFMGVGCWLTYQITSPP